MQLSAIFSLAFLASAVLGADETSSWITVTQTVTNPGNTYTRTDTQLYTGQVTTAPTSGTWTTVISVVNPTKTFVRTITQTYGLATTLTTGRVVANSGATWTVSISTVLNSSEGQSWLSSISEANAAATDGARAASATASTSSSAASSGSSSSSRGGESSSATASSSARASSSTSAGGANMKHAGLGVGAFGMAAALLI